MSTGCYDIPALEFRSRSVYTNTMALGAYRGAGRPEAAYYVERAIDLLADAAGARSGRGAADQLHRRRSSNGYTTASGENYDTGDYEKALDQALEVSGLRGAARGAGGGTEERALPRHRPGLLRRDLRLRAVRERDRPGRAERRRHGLHRHLAARPGAGDHLRPDRRRRAGRADGRDRRQPWRHPEHPAGQRHHGQPRSGGRRRRRGDGAGQDPGPGEGDRGAPAGGGGRGHRDRRGRVPGRGRARPGRDAGRDRRQAYGDRLPAEFGAGLEATDFFRPDDETFPFGTHIAVVEVFPETGEVKLVRFVSVDDCGVIISPMLVRGRSTAGSPRASARRCWRRSSTTTPASSSPAR